MIVLQNDVFLRALMRQSTEYTPVWLMRQAGRYLPEYRQTRAQAGDFLALCKNAELACEVTLQPLERYALDAAILFSDILTVPDAMGLGLYFEAGEGPKFHRPLQSEVQIRQLYVPDIASELGYVTHAVSLIRQALGGRVPLIGFSGSPWTLACYMVEGGGSKDYHQVKKLLYSRPDLMHHILSITTAAVTQYLNAQIEAGAQAVMIFDSWGGTLAHDAYKKFSLTYMQQIVSGLIKERDGRVVPSIVFTKGGGLWLEAIADIGVNAVALDWTVNLAEARQRIGAKVALQGNLDPAILLADAEAVRQQAKACVDEFGRYPGHVFNLGHGISQFTPPENVSVLVDTVHSHSRKIRQS